MKPVEDDLMTVDEIIDRWRREGGAGDYPDNIKAMIVATFAIELIQGCQDKRFYIAIEPDGTINFDDGSRVIRITSTRSAGLPCQSSAVHRSAACSMPGHTRGYASTLKIM